MRKIKFRAWDKELKEYVNINNIAIDPTNGDVVELGGYELLDVIHFAVLEQYTGLKDKNGVEIYENDVVDTHWGNEENRLVKYDNEMGFYLTPDQYQSYWTVAYRGEYEVIGNIHENADLLDDTDRISPDDIGNDIH